MSFRSAHKRKLKELDEMGLNLASGLSEASRQGARVQRMKLKKVKK